MRKNHLHTVIVTALMLAPAGQAFAVAPFILNQSSGLVSNNTTKLLVAKDGSLYIGTDNGLNQFKDGKITNTWTSARDGHDLKWVTALGQSDSEIFIGKAKYNSSYGVRGYGVERMKWQGNMYFWEDPLYTTSYISAILIDELQATCRPEIIANNWSSNPGAHIAANLTFTEGKIDLLSGESLFAVLDTKTQILLGGDNGLFVFDGNTQVAHFDGSNWGGKSGIFDATSNKSVRALVQDPSGHIWIGLQAGRYEAGGLVQYTPTSPDNLVTGAWSSPVALPGGNDVRGLAIDKNGDLWIATNDGLKLRTSDGSFKYFGLADGLPSADISDVVYDVGNQSLWIATANGVARIAIQ